MKTLKSVAQFLTLLLSLLFSVALCLYCFGRALYHSLKLLWVTYRNPSGDLLLTYDFRLSAVLSLPWVLIEELEEREDSVKSSVSRAQESLIQLFYPQSYDESDFFESSQDDPESDYVVIDENGQVLLGNIEYPEELGYNGNLAVHDKDLN